MEFLPLSDATVGSGTAGFGGLSKLNALRRWMQAWSAPDLHYMDVMKWALPFLTLLIIFEFVASLRLKQRVYYLRQFWSNMVIGGMSYLVLGIFLRGAAVFPYLYVHKHLALRTADDWIAHVIGFFGHDFLHYTGHRFGHICNIGWATHGVHHSTPDFNFVTSMRLAPDVLVTFWLFFLPLAIVIPPQVFFIQFGLGYTYQFLGHTQLVKKLPWLIELIFVTPSHHRVHHARNYPRANFGAVLILWDRLLGTFVEERPDRPCIYGLDARQTSFGTNSPLWHQVQHFWMTMKATNKAEGWDKVKMLFTRQYAPGMIKPTVTDSTSMDSTVELPPDNVPCDTTINVLDMYVLVQFGMILGPLAIFVMSLRVHLNPLHVIPVCINLIYGFNSVLTILDDQKDWKAWRHEVFRLFLSSLLAFWLLKPAVSVPFGMFSVASAFALTRMYKHVHFNKRD